MEASCDVGHEEDLMRLILWRESYSNSTKVTPKSPAKRRPNSIARSSASRYIPQNANWDIINELPPPTTHSLPTAAKTKTTKRTSPHRISAQLHLSEEGATVAPYIVNLPNSRAWRRPLRMSPSVVGRLLDKVGRKKWIQVALGPSKTEGEERIPYLSIITKHIFILDTPQPPKSDNKKLKSKKLKIVKGKLKHRTKVKFTDKMTSRIKGRVNPNTSNVVINLAKLSRGNNINKKTHFTYMYTNISRDSQEFFTSLIDGVKNSWESLLIFVYK